LKHHLNQLFTAALTIVAPETSRHRIRDRTPAPDTTRRLRLQPGAAIGAATAPQPRDLAKLLLDALPVSPYVEKAEIAGAGFINLFLSPAAKQSVVKRIQTGKAGYGTPPWDKARRSRWNSFLPTPPGRCTSAMGAGRPSA